MTGIFASEKASRWLSMLGVVGGILVWVVFFGASSCIECQSSVPGDDAYRTYETWNRLFPIPLLLMMLGVIGIYGKQRFAFGIIGNIGLGVVLFGYALMIVGSVAEFWFFTDLQYGDPTNGRSISFGVFMLGLLVLLLGSVLMGIATWRANVLPRWATFVMPMMIFGVASILIGMLLAIDNGNTMKIIESHQKPT